MRLKRTTQMSLYEPVPVDHPLGEELESISDWLGAHPVLLDAVAVELGAQAERGRFGLSCESVLRCAVLKHLRGETWRGLARFKAWVHSAVFAHNLVRLARLRPG